MSIKSFIIRTNSEGVKTAEHFTQFPNHQNTYMTFKQILKPAHILKIFYTLSLHLFIYQINAALVNIGDLEKKQ